MKIQKITLIIVLWMTCLTSWGQAYNFEKVSLEEGLSQSSVNAIVQDKIGFLWVGTQDGLNRYDGYDFRVFKKQPFDSTSLATNFITSLLIDSKNNLWIGTLSGGLHLYLPEKESFIQFDNSVDSKVHSNITSLYEDRNGMIWVGTAQGFGQLDLWWEKDEPKIKFSPRIYPSELQELFPSDQYVKTLFYDQKDRLWVGTLNGLFCFKVLIDGELEFIKKYFK